MRQPKLNGIVADVIVSLVISLLARWLLEIPVALTFVPLVILLGVLAIVVGRKKEEKENPSEEDLQKQVDELDGQVRNACQTELSYLGIEERAGLSVDWLTGVGGRGVVISLDGSTTEPESRLVVLAGPGYGKTVALLRRTLGLLRLRRIRGRVAVRVSLRGWSPAEMTLWQWMALRLHQDYGVPQEIAGKMTEGNRILPVLDGFDEVNAAGREDAAREIARLWAIGVPMVLASRRSEFEEAFRAHEQTTNAVIIELRPFDPREAIELLDPAAEPRWREVRSVASGEEETPLLEALSIPLLFGLVRAAYRDPDTDPTDLTGFHTLEALQHHLFAFYIDRVFSAGFPQEPISIHDRSRRRRGPRNFDPVGAVCWLRFLARIEYEDPEKTIAWARTPQYLTKGDRFILRLLVGLVYSLLILVFVWSAVGWELYPEVLVVTAPGALFAGPYLSWATINSSGRAAKRLAPSRMSWPGRKFFTRDLWIAFGISVAGSVAMLAAISALGRAVYGFQMEIDSGSVPEFIGGLVLFSVILTALASLAEGSSPLEPPLAQSPGYTLKRDRSVLLFRMASAFIVMFAVYSIRGDWATGAALGFALALVFTRFSAWWNFRLAAAYLALRGRLPWRYMEFLEECRRRGVLRQSGATFQFRHEMLRRYLIDGAVEQQKATAQRLRG